MKRTAPRLRTARMMPISWLIAGFAWVMLPCSDTEAARIGGVALSRSERHDDAMWANYLADGTQEWLTHAHPPVTPSLEASVWRSLADDSASANPMVEFLLWRQSVDPARFDHYHPRLAIAFAKLKSPTVSLGVISPPVSPSTVATTTPTTSAPQSVPNITAEAQQIPEPGGFWVAALVILSYGLIRPARERVFGGRAGSAGGRSGPG